MRIQIFSLCRLENNCQVGKEWTIGSILEAIGGTQWRGAKREETIKEQRGGKTRQKYEENGKDEAKKLRQMKRRA